MSDDNKCKVQFWKDKNNEGKTKVYAGPLSLPNLEDEDWKGSNNDMKDDAGTVRTDKNAWVRVYSKANYSGRSALIGPSTDINLEDLYDDEEGEDLDDTLESFQLYDQRPSVDIAKYQETFSDQFHKGERSRKNNRYNTEFYSQDSEYRVYDPEIDFRANAAYFTIRTDHIQFESDDHAVITFAIDESGNFVDKIKVQYTIAKATQIPDWAIFLIDQGIDLAAKGAKILADGAVVVVTDGVGVIFTVEINTLINITAKTLAFCVDHMNTVLSAAFIYQDDGGTMNFPAVVSHTIARAIKAYYLELYGKPEATKLAFDKSAFCDRFEDSKNKNQSFSKDGKETKNIEFNDSDGTYRIYLPEITTLYNNGGAIATVKIDAVSSGKDDHVILQTAFDPDGNIFSAIGSIDLFARNHDDGYTAPSSGVIAFDGNHEMIHITKEKAITNIDGDYNDVDSAFAALLLKDLEAKEKSFDLSLNDQQENLVEIAQRVIKALEDAVG